LILSSRDQLTTNFSEIKKHIYTLLDHHGITEPISSSSDRSLTAKIIQIKGDVRTQTPGDLEATPAHLDQTLYRGIKILTFKKSGVLLNVSGKFNLKVRLGPDSEFLIEDQNLVTHHDGLNSFFVKLIRGTSLFSVSGKDVAESFRVKTPVASFGIRGTTFLLNTDSTESNLVVTEGSVTVSKLNGPVIKTVIAGHGLWVNVIGELAHGPTIISSTPLSWDLSSDIDLQFENSSLRNELRESESKSSSSINTEPNSDRSILAKEFNRMKEAYSNRTTWYQDKVNRLKLILDEDVTSFSIESDLIREDIKCLSARNKNCSLKSEDLITRRGFPSTNGNQKYIESIIVDLRNYQAERLTTLEERRSDLKKLEEQLASRFSKQETLKDIDPNTLTDNQLKDLVAELERDVVELP